MRRAFVPLFAAFVVANCLQAIVLQGQNVPSNAQYKDAKLPADRRVADLLSRMTVEEKAAMLSGSGWMESAPIARLGIPAIRMADGPMGVRSWVYSPAIPGGGIATPVIEATAFPSGIDMADRKSVGQRMMVDL